MLKTYAVELGNGWRVELNTSLYASGNAPMCYLTLHGTPKGEIRVKGYIFLSVEEDAPENVKVKARQMVALHRDEIEAVWRRNKDEVEGRF